jgi:hypothetical protein
MSERSQFDLLSEQLNLLNEQSGELATPIHKSARQALMEDENSRDSISGTPAARRALLRSRGYVYGLIEHCSGAEGMYWPGSSLRRLAVTAIAVFFYVITAFPTL